MSFIVFLNSPAVMERRYVPDGTPEASQCAVDVLLNLIPLFHTGWEKESMLGPFLIAIGGERTLVSARMTIFFEFYLRHGPLI